MHRGREQHLHCCFHGQERRQDRRYRSWKGCLEQPAVHAPIAGRSKPTPFHSFEPELASCLTSPKIELAFINRYEDTWPAGIACLSGGLFDLKKLVTHVFPLERGIEALTLSSDPRNGSIKVHIVDESETLFF